MGISMDNCAVRRGTLCRSTTSSRLQWRWCHSAAEWRLARRSLSVSCASPSRHLGPRDTSPLQDVTSVKHLLRQHSELWQLRKCVHRQWIPWTRWTDAYHVAQRKCMETLAEFKPLFSNHYCSWMLFLRNCPVCNWIIHALDLSLIYYIILSNFTC